MALNSASWLFLLEWLAVWPVLAAGLSQAAPDPRQSWFEETAESNPELSSSSIASTSSFDAWLLSILIRRLAGSDVAKRRFEGSLDVGLSWRGSWGRKRFLALRSVAERRPTNTWKKKTSNDANAKNVQF